MKIFFTIVIWLIISQFTNLILAQSKELDYQEKPAGKILQTTDENSALIIIYSELDLTFPNYDRFKTAALEINKATIPYTYKLLISAEGKSIPLRVSANGFIPKTIEITDISPKKTIVYSIFDKNPPPTQVKGEFSVFTQPAGAKIAIDGYPTFTEYTPYTFKDYTARSYRIKLKKENYYDVDTIMVINKDKANSLNLRLKAKFGFLELTTDSNNELLIDGISYNYNNPIQLSEGEHIIKVQRKYFKDYIDTIRIVGQYDPIRIEKEIELEPYKGRVEITSNPVGADVYLNGTNIGITPINKEINAGQYILEIKKDDFRTETFNEEILENETLERNVELKKYGILRLTGTGAIDITLNGVHKGSLSSNSEFELPPGNYTVKAELAGCDTEEISFYLDSEIKTININPVVTEDRPFRWSMLGNSRLNEVTPMWSFYLTVNMIYLQPNLLSTALKYPIDQPVDQHFTWGFGMKFIYLPIIYDLDLIIPLLVGPVNAQDLSNYQEFTAYADSAVLYPFYINNRITLCPFVFFERVYPNVGVKITTIALEVNDANITEEVKQNNSFKTVWSTKVALDVNLTFRFGERYFLSLGFNKFFDDEAFGNTLYLNYGTGLK